MPGIPDIALGADEILYISQEDTYGVWKRPIGADAARMREIGFTRAQERVTRDDKLATRSHTARITKKKSVEWNVTGYVVPSGIDPSVTATPPDIGVMLKALYGAEIVNAGIDVRYTLIRNQNISLTLHRICDHFAESLTGCVPNNATIGWSGTDESTIEVTGFGKEWVITASHITGVAAGVPAVVVLGVNDDIDFDEGGGALVATVAAATYTTTATLAAAVKSALDTAGGDVYTVTYNASTRKFNIASNGVVSLDMDWISGPNTATSIKALLGYTANDTGAFTYEADDAVGIDTGLTLKIPRADDVCDIHSMVAFVDGATQYDNSGNGYHISAVTAAGFPSISVVAGVNDDIDFDEGGGPLVATVGVAVYTDPVVLGTAIKAALELAGADTYTVSYDRDIEKFIISSDGTTSLDMDWVSGPNFATSIGFDIGFTVDDTGAFSYTGDDSVTTGQITTDEAGGWETSFANNVKIIPFFPAPTVQGSPESSILGNVAIDTDLHLNTTEGSVEHNANMEARNDIFGEESSIGFSVSGRREITASMTVYLQEQYAREAKEFNRFRDLHEVVITFGNVPGSILEVHLPEFEFDNIPFTIPEQEEGTLVFTGQGLDETGPPFENEIYLVFK